ncbi:patatin-like protein [Blastomonas sp.]|uniref:patatin-like protein n=1 Tax=Blastomonas sp. TaxID=1909299 RepID=UPI00262FD8B5|nr:patatin-like protein [Blastomonas sp.]MDM7956687.1 patatin-like protein [Blastomonas sp.]
MRQKELRIALICYGGISLAVYMHGITKEIWRATRASRNFHACDPPASGSQGVYRDLFETMASHAQVKLRLLPDIIAGASAGGINGVFLAQALSSGQSLEPLTRLWLECADIDQLLDPDARPWSRFTKFWAQPLVWLLLRRPGGALDRSVAPEARSEVRTKLSRLVRARWFAPPFSGTGFSGLLYDALEAMAATPAGPRLVPIGQPLDLFVTVTDFKGHLERLRLNSPAEVVETEHRLSIGFRYMRGRHDALADPAELVFAARATASFPGAFPPFNVAELDRMLERRAKLWPGRDGFLRRIFPQHFHDGHAESAVLIDGSVLANAPFAQAIDALKNRPAHREVDRRFVYIDPKPDVARGLDQAHQRDAMGHRLPGFFSTIFGAISDIPREQPIRDNLEGIERRTSRVRQMRAITDSLRGEVEETVSKLFGYTLFLDSPTPRRLTNWRNKAQDRAAHMAGFAYASYGQLKMASIVEDIVDTLRRAHQGPRALYAERLREAIMAELQRTGLDRLSGKGGGASDEAITFFRTQDLGFRIRRLRFLARRLGEDIAQSGRTPPEVVVAMHDTLYTCLSHYLERETADMLGQGFADIAASAIDNPAMAITELAARRDLRSADAIVDEQLASALAMLPKASRRSMLLAYLGFPFYDIATLPLLQGEGQNEYDPIKVDRISPDDAQSIRSGSADATLKGIQFNSFGAFFSRAYRENDYLWGRLHGAERLIDIIASALPTGNTLPDGVLADFKRRAFLAICDEEDKVLTTDPGLVSGIRREIEAAFGK